ncbi:hypothetical protein F5Y06DRAFT_300149 [Hypoxylon sp. FL0890]|nr:hypothetical protein F5Y06DRAFT_300149 [Hypoxylon sp. FL0890]
MPFSIFNREPKRFFTVGDIQPNTILLILTNCQGEWLERGFGAFIRRNFPAAYDRYRAICQEYAAGELPTRDLVGTCQIIPPLSVDVVGQSVPPVYIACLFCSYGDGRHNWFSPKKPGRDGKAKVLAQTESAIVHFKQLLIQKGREHSTGNLHDTQWTASGKNMMILSEDNNPKDFQLKHEEVLALIIKHFQNWEGMLYLWNKVVSDRTMRYEKLLAHLDPENLLGYLDPKTKMV